jgi:hypothetical protein
VTVWFAGCVVMRGAMGPFPFTVPPLLKPLHPESENATRIIVMEHKSEIRRMNTILDWKFNIWATRRADSRGGFGHFGECIDYGLAKKYLKYDLEENCKIISF